MSDVYLLHFDRPYPRGRQPRHYIGVARSVEERMREHRNGSSKGKLTRALKEEGIGFRVVRVWNFDDAPAAFAHERQLKRQRNHKRFCPVCRSETTNQ